MSHPDITMSDQTIHNPAEPRHFLRAKPVPRLVRVRRGDTILAETTDALRVTELAKDMLDPVFYLPVSDLRVALTPVEGKTTHCPLKGDASYFADADGTHIAWTYEAPFDFADVLAGRIAFYADEVTVEEIGPNA